jgi:multiple antibiotic resistance protein
MEQYIQAIVGLLAIANPLGAVPSFLEIVDGTDEKQRRKSAWIAAVAAFAILVVAAVAGNWLLGIFGISVAAFRCGGGLVILLMGLEMLQGRTSRVQKEPSKVEDQILVPFAMPLIAGPGAITTVMTISLGERHWRNLPVALTSIAILALSLWVTLSLSQGISRLVGPRAHRIFVGSSD